MNNTITITIAMAFNMLCRIVSGNAIQTNAGQWVIPIANIQQAAESLSAIGNGKRPTPAIIRNARDKFQEGIDTVKLESILELASQHGVAITQATWTPQVQATAK
jgi:hypothetical protein